MGLFHKVLAIETSCDDTSVAIVQNDGHVLAMRSASQDKAHQPFGGIVPEVASRNHTQALLPLVEQVLEAAKLRVDELDGIVVTSRPGLIGALIVGVVTAKTLAQSFNLPVIGVNHLEGHLLAPFLKDDKHNPPENFDYPYVGLAVSGGHTSLYWIEGLGQYKILGTTLDDAAGEAFDKFAKMMGLGFPGGVRIDELAKLGNPSQYHFPRALVKEQNFSMSFSGLKASAQRVIADMSPEQLANETANLCASYQEAICDALMQKLDRAATQMKSSRVIITGGVSANSRLRALAQQWAEQNNIQLVIPPIRYCTDNAAMIGYVGVLRLNRGEKSSMSLGPSPHSLGGDFLS